ncbi:hypothetical protein [Draconibacterium orientale]|uniref:hypothetical protein n=1 Tax=Draconibacterium orientale TaxID=1168034 RepID=UPI0029C03D98|nr:hypothetical protein [Draconibacterium orientale]
MNVGVIVKIEYRLLPDGEFSEFSFTGFSGTIAKKTDRTNAGIVHETVIGLKIPGINNTKTSLLDGILFRKAQYRVTDGNGVVHLVGTDNYPARLEYTQGINGNAGSWNGYTATINHQAPQSYQLQ